MFIYSSQQINIPFVMHHKYAEQSIDMELRFLSTKQIIIYTGNYERMSMHYGRYTF